MHFLTAFRYAASFQGEDGIDSVFGFGELNHV